MSAKAAAVKSAAVGEKRRLDDGGAPSKKDKSKRSRPLATAGIDATSSLASSGAAALSSSSSGSVSGPVTFDLSGCTVACVRLPSGTGAGWADIMVKPDPDHDRRVHVFSFGRSISSDDLKSALGRGAGGVSVANRSEGAADPSNGLSMHAAVLEFRDADAAARAVDVASSFPSTDGDGSALGLKGMLGALGSHRQDPRELQLAVDIFMNAFEAAEEKAAEAKAAVAKAMDADGFTIVKHAGAAGGAGEGSGSALVESDNVKRKKKRGSIVVNNFYRFQRQDAKMDRLAELQSKFEEDKARVAKLKTAHAFKPY